MTFNYRGANIEAIVESKKPFGSEFVHESFVSVEFSADSIGFLSERKPVALGGRVALSLERVFAHVHQEGVVEIGYVYFIEDAVADLSAVEKDEIYNEIYRSHEGPGELSLALVESMVSARLISTNSVFHGETASAHPDKSDAFREDFLRAQTIRTWSTGHFFFLVEQVDFEFERGLSQDEVGANELRVNVEQCQYFGAALRLEYRQFFPSKGTGEWKIISDDQVVGSKFVELIEDLAHAFLPCVRVRTIIDTLRINSFQIVHQFKAGQDPISTREFLDYIATGFLRISEIKLVNQGLYAPFRVVGRRFFMLRACDDFEVALRKSMDDVRLFIDAITIERQERQARNLSIIALCFSALSAISSIVAVLSFVFDGGSNLSIELRLALSGAASILSIAVFWLVFWVYVRRRRKA